MIHALNPGNLITSNKACDGVSDVLVDKTIQYTDITDRLITVTVKEVIHTHDEVVVRANETVMDLLNTASTE
eukprot:3685-Heterococcus_DN1.PRE.1